MSYRSSHQLGTAVSPTFLIFTANDLSQPDPSGCLFCNFSNLPVLPRLPLKWAGKYSCAKRSSCCPRLAAENKEEIAGSAETGIKGHWGSRGVVVVGGGGAGVAKEGGLGEKSCNGKW